MDKGLDTLKLLNTMFTKWASDAADPSTAEVWSRHAEGVRVAQAELETLRRWAKPIPAKYGDLSDLPEELVNQLSGVKTDDLEDVIYTIVKSSQEPVELDQILIEIFRRTGKVEERRFINNKCYRMTSKGILAQVPKKKGLYIIPKIDEKPSPVPDIDFIDPDELLDDDDLV